MMNAMQRRRRGVRFLTLVCWVVLMMQAPTAAMAQDKEPDERTGAQSHNASPLSAPVELGSAKTSPPPSLSPQESWYGWKILTSGGASVAVSLGSFSDFDPVTSFSMRLIGITGYALGGPIIHGVYGSMGKAAASFGINLLSPALLGAIGFGLGAAEGSDYGALAGLVIGVPIGMISAVLVDSFALGYEPITAPEGSSFNIGLSVGLNGLSVVGQF
jgi:hypothetical protein